MKTNPNFVVGAFVAVALAIGVVFTVWITGKTGSEPVTNYSVLIENDASGLSLGGPVYFLGVGVGEITGLSIVSGNPPSIRVDLEVLASTPVNNGTRATLAAQGITGVSVINLSNEPGDHPPLRKSPGFDYPLIAYRDSGFSAILSSAPQILTKVESLLDRANALLDENNQDSVRRVLENIEALSAQLAAENSGMDGLATELQRALTGVQGAIADIRDLLAGTGPGLRASIENIERTTERLADVTGRLDSWLGEREGEVQRFIGDGLGQVPQLIDDARGALQEMDHLIEELRRDPSVLIYQGEFKAVPVED